MLVTPSLCLQCFVLLSSVLTFTGMLTSGLMLLLAPEEPAWDLGGGVSFTLYPSVVLLVLAVMTIAVTILGCLSISCDSRTGLSCYAVLSAILACMGVICVSVLVTFTYTNVIIENINSTLVADLMNCTGSAAQRMFDIQSKYKCCGAESATDWWQECPTEYNSTTELLPNSCCDLSEEQNVICTNGTDMQYTESCASELLQRLKYVVDGSFLWAFVGALLQLFTAGVACYGAHLIGKYTNYDIL